MHPLFAKPLHGLTCAPHNEAPVSSYVHKLTLLEASLSIDSEDVFLWHKIETGNNFRSEFNLYRRDVNKAQPLYLLKVNCQGCGLVLIDKHTITVDWQQQGTDFSHYFQTFISALWLELHHSICLHGNALASNGKALTLIAPSHMGKTTLSVALCQQGFDYMTDDMVALYSAENESGEEYLIYPSWPVARMWPKSLSLIKNNEHDLAKVHHRFAKRVLPLDELPNQPIEPKHTPAVLQTIYFLQRHESAISQPCVISDISPKNAIIPLLQNSILGDAYRALNIEQKRLRILASLSQYITFKQVHYQSGMENLAEVAEMINNDFQSNPLNI